MTIKNRITGKRAIVTGGSKGFGAGIAEVLKNHGGEVLITGRDESALKETATRLGVDHCRADVTSPNDWDRVFAEAGEVDILVNNAGLAVSIKPLGEQSDDEIAQSLAINLTGAALGCRRAAQQMSQRGDGVIVNISSICQRYVWPGWSVYSAAKAGLAQLTRGLYTELRPHGVRVSTVVPSWGATDFASTTPDLAGAPTNDPAIAEKAIKPSELGDAVAHICNLPSHLEVLEYTLVPTIQEIEPL